MQREAHREERQSVNVYFPSKSQTQAVGFGERLRTFDCILNVIKHWLKCVRVYADLTATRLGGATISVSKEHDWCCCCGGNTFLTCCASFSQVLNKTVQSFPRCAFWKSSLYYNYKSRLYLLIPAVLYLIIFFICWWHRPRISAIRWLR